MATSTTTDTGAPPAWRRANAITLPLAVLAIIAAPVALVLLSVLVVRDREHRTRWLGLAFVALLVLVPFYLLVFFSEPRVESITAQ